MFEGAGSRCSPGRCRWSRIARFRNRAEEKLVCGQRKKQESERRPFGREGRPQKVTLEGHLQGAPASPTSDCQATRDMPPSPGGRSRRAPTGFLDGSQSPQPLLWSHRKPVALPQSKLSLALERDGRGAPRETEGFRAPCENATGSPSRATLARAWPSSTLLCAASQGG